ncbi:unnamed protein product [Cunninghamella blakesleeana]
MKYNYLLATLFIYLNLISHAFCCRPTTLTIWKSQATTTISYNVDAYIEARLVVEGYSPSEFTGKNRKTIKQRDWDKYKNMFSTDKKFGLHAGYYKRDLTYTWGGKEQYIEKPVKIEYEDHLMVILRQ